MTKTTKEDGVLEARNLSEQVYALLRRDILLGDFLPDTKLQIEAVSERYDIGAVPVREALNRLSAEGLVRRIKQRGFFVAPLSIGDLDQLVRTRIWAESKALTDSMANATDRWEEDLVLSFHRLSRVTRNIEPGSERSHCEEWDVRHKEFHMHLVDRCGSTWLIDFCSQMMDQAVRYRNISMNISSSAARREGAADEHKSILDAILNRDADTACMLLNDHYLATLSALLPDQTTCHGQN